MKMKRRIKRPPMYLVQFDGEARKIGSGKRLIHIDSIGPKWVKIRCAIIPGRVARLPRATWNIVMRSRNNREVAECIR